MADKKPHVHAEVIKAWADGAEIEYYDQDYAKWRDATKPNFYPNKQYRVKPKPHKWQKEQDAFAAGKEVQFSLNDGVDWYGASTPTFEGLKWRIKPTNKWPHVQEAFLAGKTIQLWYPHGWMDWGLARQPNWEEDKWRIKPEDIVALSHIALIEAYSQEKGTNYYPLHTGTERPNVEFIFDGETKNLKAVKFLL